MRLNLKFYSPSKSSSSSSSSPIFLLKVMVVCGLSWKLSKKEMSISSETLSLKAPVEPFLIIISSTAFAFSGRTNLTLFTIENVRLKKTSFITLTSFQSFFCHKRLQINFPFFFDFCLFFAFFFCLFWVLLTNQSLLYLIWIHYLNKLNNQIMLYFSCYYIIFIILN